MSWSIQIVGRRADVKAAVLANTNLPQALKVTVIAIADAGENNRLTPECAGLIVESTGHYAPGDNWSNIHSFSVKPCHFAEPPKTEEPPKTG